MTKNPHHWEDIVHCQSLFSKVLSSIPNTTKINPQNNPIKKDSRTNIKNFIGNGRQREQKMLVTVGNWEEKTDLKWGYLRGHP